MSSKFSKMTVTSLISKAAKGEFAQSKVYGKGQKKRSIAIWSDTPGDYNLELLAYGMQSQVITGNHDKIYNTATSFLSESN